MDALAVLRFRLFPLTVKLIVLWTLLILKQPSKQIKSGRNKSPEASFDAQERRSENDFLPGPHLSSV